MKIRLDYVTNSSSSSFLIARKKNLTLKQKEHLLSFAEALLGKEIIRTKDELDEYFREEYGEPIENGEIDPESYYFDEYQKALAAINRGLVIYEGYVSFEGDETIFEIYHDLFAAMKDDDNYVDINIDLEY